MMQASVRQPQQKRSEVTRKRILEEARKEFAARGFDATNVRDIADAAGTTHSMIRYHFGTKDQLWRETVRQMFELQHEKTQAPESDVSLSKAERLKGFVRRYVMYCAQHPEHSWITIQETISGGDRLEWMVNSFVKDNHAGALGLFKELMDDGIIPECDPVSLVYCIAGMAQLPFVMAKQDEISFPADPMDDARIERHIETMTALLLR